MKDTLIKNIKSHVIKAPLIYPFRTALGQHNHLENIIVELELNDGTKGYGEAAIATHITGETIEGTLKNLKNTVESLIGKDVSKYRRLSDELNERLSANKSALAGLEISIADAFCRQKKIPLWKLFGNRPKRIVSDITIVISSLEETEEAVRAFLKQGFRTFKIKVGRDEKLDLKRVMAVHKTAPRSRLYIDANQGYTAEETLDFLKLLKENGIVPALVEQPVPRNDFEGLKKVSRLAGTLICADESVKSLDDVKKIIRHNAAGAVNIKFMKFGLFRGHDVYTLCQRHGLKLMIGGMMETSVSMTAAAHFAAGLGGIDFIDLDCPFFIKKGWERNPYLSKSGVYDLKKSKPGIGITPDK